MDRFVCLFVVGCLRLCALNNKTLFVYPLYIFCCIFCTYFSIFSTLTRTNQLLAAEKEGMKERLAFFTDQTTDLKATVLKLESEAVLVAQQHAAEHELWQIKVCDDDGRHRYRHDLTFTYIHTYIHIYIRTYIHTYIHT